MKPNQNSFILIYICFVLLNFPINNSFLKLTEVNYENKASKEEKNTKNDIDKNILAIVDDKSIIDTDQYEKVEFKKTTNFLAKTPTYVKSADKDGMKSATLIQTNEKQISLPGMTERPNYLSTVIRNSPTRVTASGITMGSDGPTFDLETIRKKKLFDMLEKSPHPENPNVLSFGNDNVNFLQNQLPISGNVAMTVPIPDANISWNPNNRITTPMPYPNPNLGPGNSSMGNMMQNIQIGQNSMLQQLQGMPYTNQNFGLQTPQGSSPNLGYYPNAFTNPSSQVLSLDSLPMPDPLPIPTSSDNIMKAVPPPVIRIDPFSHTSPMEASNSQTFNMQVQYKGFKIKHPQSLISDLTEIGEKINRINELSGSDIANIIKELKGHEQNLTNLSSQTYKNLKQYQSQNNVILDSLREEIMNSDNQLKGMIVEVPGNEIGIIKNEIEEEFTRSLEGYTINKNKYPHLRELDPKEINEISSIIKSELNRNDKFYMHGDFNLF